MASKKTKPFDASRYLEDDEAIAAYINEALSTCETDVITHAIGVAAKARGMAQVAESAGLSRESLYKALSGEGNPQFETVLKVFVALGLQLKAEPANGNDKRAA
jgi:probable addiction module antidote protein